MRSSSILAVITTRTTVSWVMRIYHVFYGVLRSSPFFYFHLCMPKLCWCCGAPNSTQFYGYLIFCFNPGRHSRYCISGDELRSFSVFSVLRFGTNETIGYRLALTYIDGCVSWLHVHVYFPPTSNDTVTNENRSSLVGLNWWATD